MIVFGHSAVFISKPASKLSDGMKVASTPFPSVAVITGAPLESHSGPGSAACPLVTLSTASCGGAGRCFWVATCPGSPRRALVWKGPCVLGWTAARARPGLASHVSPLPVAPLSSVLSPVLSTPAPWESSHSPSHRAVPCVGATVRRYLEPSGKGSPPGRRLPCSGSGSASGSQRVSAQDSQLCVSRSSFLS